MYSMNEDKYFIVVCVELFGIEKGNKMVNIMWILVMNWWEHILRRDKWMHLQHSMIMISGSMVCTGEDNTYISMHTKTQTVTLMPTKQNIKINNNIINTTIKPLELVFYWNVFNKSYTNTNTYTIRKLIFECIGFVSSLLSSNIRKFILMQLMLDNFARMTCVYPNTIGWTHQMLKTFELSLCAQDIEVSLYYWLILFSNQQNSCINICEQFNAKKIQQHDYIHEK